MKRLLFVRYYCMIYRKWFHKLIHANLVGRRNPVSERSKEWKWEGQKSQTTRKKGKIVTPEKKSTRIRIEKKMTREISEMEVNKDHYQERAQLRGPRVLIVICQRGLRKSLGQGPLSPKVSIFPTLLELDQVSRLLVANDKGSELLCCSLTAK